MSIVKKMSCYCTLCLLLLLFIEIMDGSCAAEIGLLGAQCSTTRNGCACKSEWSVGDSGTLRGCQNPGRHAKQPWCVVDKDEDCRAFRGILADNQFFDFCLPDCQHATTNSTNSITISGCVCNSERCHNPDKDLLGNWCIVEENNCCVNKKLGYTNDGKDRFDYCYYTKPEDTSINDKVVLETAQIEHDEDCQQSYLLSVLVTDEPNSDHSNLQGPSLCEEQLDEFDAAFTPQLLPDIQEVKGCESLISVLNETTDLSLFRDILLETNLTGEISEYKNLTILAPTNSAIEAFANAQNIDVGDFFLFKSNIAALKRVMKLHFVEGELRSGEFFQRQEPLQTLLLDQQLKIEKDENFTDIIIIIPPSSDSPPASLDIHNSTTCQGAMYNIDQVLVPKVEAT